MSSNQTLLKQTDQCVLCGLCLPHCPTYQVSHHEGESPRGRISLVKAFASGKLDASPAVQQHLQSCTMCQRCESVCPANVPFRAIMDQGRAMYRKKLDYKSRFLQFWSTLLLSKYWGHTLLRLLSRLPFIDSIYFPFNVMKVAIKKPGTTQHADGRRQTDKQKITLFTGCTGNLFERETIQSATQLIKSLNFSVEPLDTSFCCGALAQHSGQLDRADRQIDSIKKLLQSPHNAPLVSIATGCGQQLNRIGNSVNHSHLDIHCWLAKYIDQLQINALPKQVAIHVPCTMSEADCDAMFSVLRKIPAIHLHTLDNHLFCCGAGGMQLLTPSISSEKLLQSKVDFVARLDPDVIVSPNIGCTLHLQKGLRENKLDIEIIHPITLLARQIKI